MRNLQAVGLQNNFFKDLDHHCRGPLLQNSFWRTPRFVASFTTYAAMVYRRSTRKPVSLNFPVLIKIVSGNPLKNFNHLIISGKRKFKSFFQSVTLYTP